jgi:urea transporter
MKEAEQLLDSSSRGIGQVIFLNSPTSGAIILGGLAVGNPGLAGMAALGAVTSTATAKAAGLDEAAIKDGLLTYNGFLVGCAASVFGPTSMLACTTSTIVGAAATPFVSATLKETMTEIPQWTYSFNLVALTSLLRTRPFLPADDVVAVSAATSDSDGFGDLLLLSENDVTAEVSSASESVGFGDLLVSPFTGISQIFVVESPLSGAIIWYGIGMVSVCTDYSVILARVIVS